MVWILSKTGTVDKMAFETRIGAAVRRDVRGMAQVVVLALTAQALVYLALIPIH
jgi:hypothetical protein